MSKRLAITISGAVSLGCYEAGLLYEICEALRQHNEDPQTIANPADRIKIDVLTGASAGGMTAVIAAQSLLYSGNALKDPQKQRIGRLFRRRSSASYNRAIPWTERRLKQPASGGEGNRTTNVRKAPLEYAQITCTSRQKARYNSK